MLYLRSAQNFLLKFIPLKFKNKQHIYTYFIPTANITVLQLAMSSLFAFMFYCKQQCRQVINFSYKSNGNNNPILHHSCACKNSHTANYTASTKGIRENTSNNNPQ
jgi:hypothetical protein